MSDYAQMKCCPCFSCPVRKDCRAECKWYGKYVEETSVGKMQKLLEEFMDSPVPRGTTQT